MHLWFSLAMFSVFLAFCFYRRDLRKAMIWAGLLSTPIFYLKALISPGFLRDAFGPGLYAGYFFQALVFGFSFGAVSSAAFEVLFHKKLKVVPHPHKESLRGLVVGPLVFTLSMLVFSQPFGTSIALGFFSQAAVLTYHRKDLLWDAIVSGLFLAVVYVLFYSAYFLAFPGYSGPLWFADLSGLMIFSLPAEEFLAVFSFGLLWGPLYEGFKKYKLEDIR